MSRPRIQRDATCRGDLRFPLSSSRASCGLLIAGLVATIVALAVPTAGAATFNYFSAPYDVTPGSAGSWQDVNVSAYVPAGATGVIVQYLDTSGVDQNYGIRKKGSADPFYPSAAKADFQGFLMTGLDSSRVFQVYTGSTQVKTYLVGYTMSGVTFFTNRIDKSTATTGSFVDVNIGADTGTATAIGAIFHVQNTSGSSVNYAVRKKGSTDNRLFGLRANNANVVMIGVDGTETAQQQIASNALDLYLVGYVTSGAVFFTNGIDKSTGTTGSYVDVDITADVGPGVANGAFLEIYNDSGNRRLTAVRPKGATYDYYSLMQHQFGLVGIDANDVFQQKIELAEMHVFLTGYSLADGVDTFLVKSGQYTGTGVARSISGIGFQPDVVIIDGVNGGADAAIKTSTMAGANSKLIDNGSAFDTVHITSLDPDGFSLGTDPDINQNGITYYWVAFQAAPGAMKVGTYAGSAGAQNVTGVGFTPDYVIVMSPNAARPMQRSSLMPAGFSLDFAGAGYSNSILNVQPNGFGLGTDSSVASAGTTFHYVAWTRVPGQIAIGNYAGNKAPGRDITGAGFFPEYVIVDRSSDVGGPTGTSVGNAPAHKTAASGVNVDSTTLFNGNVAEADNVMALQTDGFKVGTHCRVNGDGTCNAPVPVNYYWVAFGPHTPQIHYRSIGPAADESTGTLTATTGSPDLTGAGTLWKTRNRGRGDVITICDDPPVCSTNVNYVVHSVATDTTLSLTTPYAGSAGGLKTFTLKRQFTRPSDWASCIDGPPGCPYFSSLSSSLVADDRREVGILYNDDGPDGDSLSEPFVPPGAGQPIVWITGVTTDAAHTITLTADGGNRHSGVAWGGSGATPHVVLSNSAGNGEPAVRVGADFVTVEWLEIRDSAPGANSGIDITAFSGGITPSNGSVSSTVIVRNDLFHDLGMAIDISNTSVVVDVYNNFMYNCTRATRIEANQTTAPSLIRVLNNTAWGCTDGFHVGATANGRVQLRNNIAAGSTGNDFWILGALSAQSSDNLSEDATATGASPGGGDEPSRPLNGAGGINFVDDTLPTIDLHLQASSWALDRAVDLSSVFSFDIDGGARQVLWDIGADDTLATTAVELLSFEAEARSGSVSIRWETGSELKNLGFHLYRSTSTSGALERLTSSVIPGLGSSPQGAKYSYLDASVENGVTYVYYLEDIETTGETTRHGPVTATPLASLPVADGTTSRDAGFGVITYGDPSNNALRINSRGRDRIVLTLHTEGFVARTLEEGAVAIEVPGFVDLPDRLPVRREWVDAVAGRKVELVSVHEAGVEKVGLRAWGGGTLEAVGARDGTVQLRRSRRSFRWRLSESASISDVVFQREVKRALIELAPLSWADGGSAIRLARDLEVVISFQKVEPTESAGRRRRRTRTDEARPAAMRLVTRDRGLHAVSLRDVFGRRNPKSSLRLSRLGKSVPYHLEGAQLFFWSDGAKANPYGKEAVYELELVPGEEMQAAPSSGDGATVPFYWHRVEREENRLYGAGLLDAEDLWQWDVLVSGTSKRYAFEVEGLASGVEGATLEVRLVGGSDFASSLDHHVRAYVNGTWVGEGSWDGKTSETLSAAIPEGVLRDGGNELSLENVGDTDASYSLVYLDLFSVEYPRRSKLVAGRFPSAGNWNLEKPSYVLDVTGPRPLWVPMNGGDRLAVEGGHRYVATPVSEVRTPELRRVSPSRFRTQGLQADYVAIAPLEFREAAKPLLEHRSAQGLTTQFVPLEDVYEEFGYGEVRPEAIRDFLRYAYDFWQSPSPRYVVLLGDGTYDFKDYLGTGVPNRVPPLLAKTSFLWTASDPAYASVNGEDLVPDLAIGRLPAASVEELRVMVDKILAYEAGDLGRSGTSVLVTDNPDAGGNFDRNADELESTMLPGATRISLAKLGVEPTRRAILAAFDAGASTMSYIGHGGIHLWASEDLFDKDSPRLLSAGSEQPIVLTMNCLNGYFHFPYFDSLSEALVKAEGKGAIAAFSPTGLSLNEPAHELHRALLGELASGRHERLGDAILAAESDFLPRTSFPELLTIFHLIGDPALVLR